MSVLIVLFMLIPLLILPGWLITRAFSGAHQPSDPLERLYTYTITGALLNGWLAFLLAEGGLFFLWLHLLILLASCAAAALIAQRRGSLTLPATPLGIIAHPLGLQGSGSSFCSSAVLRFLVPRSLFSVPRPSFQAIRSFLHTNWEALTLAAIGILFTLLVARPFEVILGVRDAGVYANTGFAIARTGSITQTDPPLAALAADQQAADPTLRAAAAQAETNFLGVQNPQRTIATRQRAAGFFIPQGDLAEGRVVPQFFHLYPSWIALLTALAGFQAGLFATGLLGLFGVWSVALLGRRLAGSQVGLLAALLLALNGAQVWFSRYSTSEALAQCLTFAGLFFFAVSFGTSVQRTNNKEQKIDPQSSIFNLQSSILAGLAFGQLALTRIDFALVIAPLLGYILYIWLSHRWNRLHSWFTAMLGLMLLHAGLHIAFIARAYFFDTLFARLQDYALPALISLPFLTPALRQVYLLRPCSPIAVQPCPPVAGMPPTVFTSWNYPRIAAELLIVVIVIGIILALYRWGRRPIAFFEQLLSRTAHLLTSLIALLILLLGGYAYLIRPQILTPQTLAALPSCLSITQLRAPQGACLTLQGYVGAPITPPRYPDSVTFLLDTLPARLRGRAPALNPTICATIQPGSALAAPPNAGPPPDYLRNEAYLPTDCRDLRLRDLFANSQANLVRVGWYLSPLGLILGIVGLALWWRNELRRDTWLFLLISLITGFTFIRLTYGASDQTYIYILRRYIPQVYPALSLGIAYAIMAMYNGQKTQSPAHPLTRSPAHLLTFVRKLTATTLALALLAFLIITGRPLFRHVEYGGALEQIQQIATNFGTNDILLLRGGAPTYADARDLPDLLATPLTYAFGVEALTIKSATPERYAPQLAAYIRHWQSQGRQVYLGLAASGAFRLPGLHLEPVAPVAVRLREFEQLDSQKPSNIQDFALDFMIYRLVPGEETATATHLAANEVAAQLHGFYRAEQIAGQPIAWTDGDALLRLPFTPSAAPHTLSLRLAAGERPATKLPVHTCLSYRLEQTSESDPTKIPFSPQQCVTLTSTLDSYTFTLDPRLVSAQSSTTLLLHITSDTWIPARDAPPQNDPRTLGVQFGGLTIDDK